MEQDDIAWGAALMLLKRHQNGAPFIVAARIGELALAGDREGVAVWKSVAASMEQIMRTHQGTAN
ncbi:MAG: hypothetical protein VYA35_11865 [Pseudomonadota bacterium]|nr:hypothetical protein [Sphingobium naphthae]MEE2742047.1 hypothetical protein [Pseudomonadota bacterium]|tara:strand:+ start:2445 stop:2639 length:195 start_codon:yes stop_codon:yes gene_type:complete